MKRIILVVLTLASSIGIVFGYLSSKSYQFGVCIVNDVLCHHFYERVGDALMYGMGALSLGFLLLLFVPQAWHAWKKFAIWYVPIAALIFVIYDGPGAWDFVSPYPETLFQFVSALYVVISIAVIGRVAIRSRSR